MYIVRKGRLSVVSEDGSITFANLTDGAVFGELSVLNIQGNEALVDQIDSRRPRFARRGNSWLVRTKNLFRIMMSAKRLFCICLLYVSERRPGARQKFILQTK